MLHQQRTSESVISCPTEALKCEVFHTGISLGYGIPEIFGGVLYVFMIAGLIGHLGVRHFKERHLMFAL
jgi:hypothetical protein